MTLTTSRILFAINEQKKTRKATDNKLLHQWDTTWLMSTNTVMFLRFRICFSPRMSVDDKIANGWWLSELQLVCWYFLMCYYPDPHYPVLRYYTSIDKSSRYFVVNHWWLRTLVQQLLSVGGLFALRLKESIDAFPDQILPARPARCSQSTCFYGDDLPWSGRPHGHEHTLIHTVYKTQILISTWISELPVGSCLVMKDSVLKGWVRGIRQAIQMRQVWRSE